MADEQELRHRYRRDFSSEPLIGGSVRPRDPAMRPPSKPQIRAAQPQPAPLKPSPVETIGTDEDSVLPSIEHIAQRSKKPKRVKRNNRKKGKIFLSLLFAVALAGVGAGLAYINNRQPAQQAPAVEHFPISIKAQVNIPLYYPENLPAGYVVNNDFKVVQKNVIYYTVKAPDGAFFYVTLQAAANDFDFQTFENKLTGKTTVNTPVGIASIGTLNSSLISSIRTNANGWIIVNTDAAADTAQMKSIDKTFQKSK